MYSSNKTTFITKAGYVPQHPKRLKIIVILGIEEYYFWRGTNDIKKYKKFFNIWILDFIGVTLLGNRR